MPWSRSSSNRSAADGDPCQSDRVTIDAVFGQPLPEVVITDDHVELRPFAMVDLDLIEEASRDPFIPTITTVPATYTAGEGAAFIDRQTSRMTSGEGWSLAIVDPDRGRAVGQIGLWISHLSKGRAEIGYWVAPSGRGSGIARAATMAMTAWAFEQLDVDRLSLFIEPWNTASIRTAEAAGFTREALLHDWERVDGVAKDMWSYVRLRSERQISAGQ